MTEQQNPSSGRRRAPLIVLWVAIALVVVLLIPLRQSSVLVEVYGVEVAVWLVAVVFYLAGIVAGFAAFRARQA